MEIREVLHESLINKDLENTKKLPAIKELVQLLSENGYITDAEEYLEAVKKREEEFTTGLGRGIAIPHGKSQAVKEPCVCFGRSTKGIDYGAEDGEPVHLMFLIAVPKEANDEHLRILANLSRKLIHQEVLDKLMNANNAEEIYQILS